MNKKLICLLLSVVMLLSVVLTSCGQKDDEDVLENITEEASAATVTLAMYLMSEAPVSAEQEAAMEKAVNVLTKAKYKAQIDLTFLTPDKYYEALEANLNKQSQNADLYVTEDSTTQPETEKDDLGIETLKYPALKANQVDIFYFSGYDKYVQYMNEGFLKLLNEEVEGDAKALKAYLTPSLLSYMKIANNNNIYAIPTNRAIGNYTYLLLNKDVLAKTNYDVTDTKNDFSSLVSTDVQELLATVTSTSLGTQYVPLHSFTGEVDVLNYQYWGVDENGMLSNDFSVLGGAINPEWEYGEEGSYSQVNNIFDDSTYTAQLKILSAYKNNGYYNEAAVNAGADFAVGYIKGGPEIIAQYGDKYEVIPVAMPTLYTQDLYQDMFGVSAYTVNLSRSMDIITYLNTDEEFRNLLLYGIEGENYELVDAVDEDGNVYKDANGDSYKQVKYLNHDYQMDINKTGNTLLAYTVKGENPFVREYAKAQNNDIQVAYSMGFRTDYGYYGMHMDYMKQLREISAGVLAVLANDPSQWESLSQFTRDQAKVLYYMTEKSNNRTEGEYSFAAVYYAWLEAQELYNPDPNQAS